MALLVMALLFQWNGQIIPVGGEHDSLKYLQMAESLIQGKWLGDYNQMTLIRRPAYPFLMMLNCRMGWPLQRSQAIFYLLSILILLTALRSVNIGKWRLVVIGAFCAFHPAAVMASMYVATESVDTAAATGILAASIGVMGSLRKSDKIVYCWITVLSAYLALFWYIRSESMWILPVGIFYIFFIQRELGHSSKNNWKVMCFALLLPCLSVYSIKSFIQHENMKCYGIGVTDELSEPDFISAFHWLTRLDGERHHPYIPVSQAALDDAYRVSKHFAMLEPFLSQQTAGRGWTQFGCEWMGICNELAGGWLVWAVRDAAASIGVYQNAPSARRFFAEVTSEVRSACRVGVVKCSGNPTGNMLAPPLKWQDLPRIAGSFIKMTVLAVTFGKLYDTVINVSLPKPPADLIARYDRLTHDQFPPHKNISNRYLGVLIHLFLLIQISGGIWILAVSGKVLLNGIRGCRMIFRQPSQMVSWIILLILIYIASRFAVVAYIDAMSFHAQLRYLVDIYPAMMTLIVLFLPFRTKKPV